MTLVRLYNSENIVKRITMFAMNRKLKKVQWYATAEDSLETLEEKTGPEIRDILDGASACRRP